MNQKSCVQNDFLAALCENKATVAVYLINGIKLHGTISGFDDFTVSLQEPTQQLISKNAIATVLPLSATDAAVNTK